MSTGRSKVEFLVQKAVRGLLLQYSSTAKQPYNWQMGKLDELGMATLADGSTVQTFVRGRPGLYAPVYNLGNGMGLVEAEEAPLFIADSTGSAAYILSRSGTTIYVRKTGVTNKVYSLDLAQFGLSSSSFSTLNGSNYLVSFSPDGRHIGIGTYVNSTSSVTTLRVPGYIGDLDNTYYLLTGQFIAPSPKTFNVYYPVMRYVVLKDFTLQTSDSGANVIGYSSVQYGSMDLPSKYLPLFGDLPPTRNPSTYSTNWHIEMNSSDGLDQFGLGYTTLGMFYTKMELDVAFNWNRVDQINNWINEPSSQGFTRVYGSWSFTTDEVGEPLLEFYTYIDNVRYQFDAFYPTSYSVNQGQELLCNIRPGAFIDGCPTFQGTARMDYSTSFNYPLIGLNRSTNPWLQGSQSSMDITTNLFPSLTFNNITEVMESSNKTWSGVLTRDSMGGFCATTYTVTNCFDTLDTFEMVLVPAPTPGQFEPPGVLAWPAGASIPIPPNQAIGNLETPPGTKPPGSHIPVGPLYNGPPGGGFGYTTRFGPEWGYSEYLVTGGSNQSEGYFFTPSCYSGIEQNCPNDSCSNQTYPQTAGLFRGFYVMFSRNAVRTTIKGTLNQNNVFTVMDQGTIVEDNVLDPLNQSYTFDPSVLTSTYSPSTVETAIRHGVTGMYNLAGKRSSKNLSYNPPSDSYMAGGIPRVYKSPNNSSMAYLEVETNMLETGCLFSQPDYTQATQMFYPTVNVSSVTQGTVDPPATNRRAPSRVVTTNGTTDLSSLNLNMSFIPIITSSFIFTSLPTFLTTSQKYRATDPDIFISLTVVSGKRNVTRYQYSNTDGAIPTKIVIDNNNVAIPGILEDVWTS